MLHLLPLQHLIWMSTCPTSRGFMRTRTEQRLHVRDLLLQTTTSMTNPLTTSTTNFRFAFTLFRPIFLNLCFCFRFSLCTIKLICSAVFYGVLSTSIPTQATNSFSSNPARVNMLTAATLYASQSACIYTGPECKG